MGIVAENLSFSYGQNKILDNISFVAEEGNLICLLGKNGVGKTTLFQILLGSLKSYEGNIRINEKSLKKYQERELALQLAYIPQSYQPAYNYTVEEMVLMGVTPSLGMFESPKKEHKIRAEKALEKVGLSSLKRQNFCRISSGEKQLVLIARAIAQNSKILLMDEPASNLDFGNGIRIMKLCRELTRNGYLIIQSTHNPQHALSYAGQVIVLDGGRIVAKGTPAESLTEEVLNHIYQVPVKLIQAPECDQKICISL